MAALLVVLALFLVAGAAQALMAGRLVDLIHGGPGRRAERGRRFDMLVLRVAGWFIAAVAAGAMIFLVATGIGS